MIRLIPICLFLFILAVLPRTGFTGEAEITHIILKNTQSNLEVDIKIKGVFTKEIQDAVLNGIPVSFIFSILLYEVKDYWLDHKIVEVETIHKIQYDVLREEYKILRSWAKTNPVIIKKLEKAHRLISEVDGLKIISNQDLIKGGHYQLRVKLELLDKKYDFTRFPWEIETDWYIINFLY